MQTLDEQNEIREVLARLDADPALAALHDRLTAFNFFEAVGMYGQEIRHSHFLALLLSPHESHGLGDIFLRWFLREIVSRTDHSPSPETVDAWDLSDTEVWREWQNIDLFITSPQNRLTVVIENKVWSGEHSNQLERYKEIAHAHGYDKGTLQSVYLTPHGGKSSHDWYTPIGYEAVCVFLEGLCAGDAIAKPDARLAIHHYTRLLRRHIVGDPETTRLCRELYEKHKVAMDSIYVTINNTDRQKQAASLIEGLIVQEEQWVKWYSGTYTKIHFLHFVPKTWANETGLDKSANARFRLIYVQTATRSDGSVLITGVVAPASESPKNSAIRQKVLLLLKDSFSFSSLSADTNDGKYMSYYQHVLRDAPTAAEDENGDALRAAWHNWIATEGPKFINLIQPGAFSEAKSI